MKQLRIIILAFVAGITLWSCKEDDMPQELAFNEAAVVKELMKSNPDLNSLTQKGYRVTQSSLLRTSDKLPVGTTYLVRYDEGLLTVVKSDNIEPGTAATLWWVFFNAPENCVEGCNSADFTNAAVKADAMYADGQLIDNSGKTVFTSHRKLNELEGSAASFIWGGSAIGIKTADKVEAHLVVRTHGPVIPGMEEAMTGTFNGGCQGFPSAAGEPGPNTCGNIQSAIHLPDMSL